MNINDLRERIGSTSPSNDSFGINGDASATMTYIVDGPMGKDGKIDGFLRTVFAQSAMSSSSSAQIVRSMPMAHPYYRWMYATQISGIKGIGLKRSGTGVDQKMDYVATGGDSSYQKVPAYFGAYDKYEVTVKFSPLPYFVLPDENIQTVSMSYFKDDGNTAQIPGGIRTEYDRFVSFATTVAAEYVTIKAGNYKFISQHPEVNLKTFPGFGGKTLLPKTVINMTWHQVPYNFVFPTLDQSDNIYNGLGRINQFAFQGFEPGELLFTGVESKPYTRNFFGGNFNIPNPTAAGWGLASFLYADVTFKFLYVGFKSDYNVERSAANPSYVYKGHNLGIWLANQKYYPMVTNTNATIEGTNVPIPDNQRWKPVYDSYPFQLLFHGSPANMS